MNTQSPGCQARADLVLKPVQESALRYQQKKSLGNLGGVPTAIKDEYGIVGYTTCWGSVTDFTGQVLDGETIDSWCVKKLEQDPGCIPRQII